MIWLLTLAAAAAEPTKCPTADLNATAQNILRGFQTKNFSCIRKMTIGAEAWFDGDKPKFLDDMTFKSDGSRRLDDILNEHGAVAVAEPVAREGAIFLIDKKYYPLFLKGETMFLKRYKYTGYRKCVVKRISGVWMLTEDFCYMESD